MNTNKLPVITLKKTQYKRFKYHSYIPITTMEGRAKLLEHLNSGKNLLEFPDIKKINSMDDIKDGQNIIQNPDDATVKLVENVVVNVESLEGEYSVVELKKGTAYLLEYSVEKKGLVFNEKDFDSIYNAILKEMFKEGKIYQVDY